MRWPSMTLIVFLVFLLAAVGGGSLLTQANLHSTIPLREILTYEPLKPTPDELAISDIPAPIEFERIADVPYGPHGWRNCLDIYLPEKAKRPMPVVVLIHGGGTYLDTKEESPNGWMSPLLARGYAVVQNNYRIIYVTPGVPNPHKDVGAPFPAQIQDCKAAIRFLRANSAKYGLDPNRIGVMGHSMGGYLAALVGTTGDMAEFDRDGENQEESSGVQAACLVNGITDLRAFFHQQVYHEMALGFDRQEWNVARDVATNTREYFPYWLGVAVDKSLKIAERASPVTYVTPDDPPFLIIHGFDDVAVPPYQGNLLYVKLRNAGVDANLQIVPGGQHGGPTLYNTATRKTVVEFFDRHLVERHQ